MTWDLPLWASCVKSISVSVAWLIFLDNGISHNDAFLLGREFGKKREIQRISLPTLMEKEGGEKIRKQESKMWMEIKENCFLSNVKEFI